MDHSPRPDTKDRFKNLAIALLVLVVVVETGILLTTRGPGSPGPDVVPATEPGQEGVSIAGAALDAPLNRNLWVSLDRPLFEGLSGTTLDPSPVTIAPEAEGSWRVLNPYTLIFAADPPLKEDTQYTLALSQEGLPGKAAPTANATAVVRTGKFLVESVKLDENPAPEGGAMALVQGSVRFNTDVTPRPFWSTSSCTRRRNRKNGWS